MSHETDELRGLARRHGATRVYVPETGIGAWQFPAWVCPHCGPDKPVRPGCPDPLARHGPIEPRGEE